MINLSKIKDIFARRLITHLSPWATSYWADKPLGDRVRASKEQYLTLWENEKKNKYSDIDALEAEHGVHLDKDWMDDLALHTQIVIKSSPLCYQHGRILYTILRSYCAQGNTQDLTIFETGTARGFSAIVMAKALQDEKKAGKILTFDVLPHHAPIYWNCIDDHEGKKSRAELLSKWSNELNNIIFVEGDSRINLKSIKPDRVHFAFLDGAHSYEHVLFEFKTIESLQITGDIIVFDDYNQNDFAGLVRAVDDGCNRFGYEKNVIRLSGKDRAYVVATKK